MIAIDQIPPQSRKRLQSPVRAACMRSAAALIWCCAAVFPVGAQDSGAEVEHQLELAIRYNFNTEERLLASGDLIRALADNGFVRLKPDARYDYNDYRVFLKPVSLHGHKLLMIEEEYLIQHIGCCVDPGFGLVLERNGSVDALQTLATANGCAVETGEDARKQVEYSGLAPTGVDYVYVSCREWDMQRHREGAN